jgi:hypothetical protein
VTFRLARDFRDPNAGRLCERTSFLLPLLMGLVVWFVLRNRTGPEMRPPTETSEEILKRRHA